MKDLDEDKLETSGKKLVSRGDGSGRLIGIFSREGKEIYDSDISEWVSKSEMSETYFILATNAWASLPLNCTVL